MKELPVIATYEIINAESQARTAEPLYIDLPGTGDGDLSVAIDDGPLRPVQILMSRPGTGVAIVDLGAAPRLCLRLFATNAPAVGTAESIITKPAVERDGVVRIDTGTFELELCRGTARGTTRSKWGIRHFMDTAQRVDLIRDGANSIGGVYAPFFTPENGLINPPEHAIADVVAVETGPLLHEYRMTVRIPDGLLPELRGKWLTIDWTFFAGTRWFERNYSLTGFGTEVDGRSVVNKLTVGDEFEAGRGALVFNRFATREATTFREGAPYSAILARAVRRIVAEISEDSPAELLAYREAIAGDITAANWDWYWRLFSIWEGFLPHDRIRAELATVRAEAHRASDAADRIWNATSDPLGVDVPAAIQSTIFVGPADRSAALNTTTGYGMVWWTSKPAGGFDIQQRRESGWSNWGTNSENERPELPNDVRIRTSYGRFGADWQSVADVLAAPVQVQPQAVPGRAARPKG